MDEYEKVEQMKARFAGLKKTYEDGLGQTAMFISALLNELHDESGEDVWVDFVVEALSRINQRLAKDYEALHRLEHYLY